MVSDNLIISALIFLAVVLAVWGIRNMIADSVDKADKADKGRLPAIYRMFSLGIFFFSEEAGSMLENLFPKQSDKIREELRMAAYPMEVKDVYGASLFFLFAGLLLGLVLSLSMPESSLKVRILIACVFGVVGLIFPRMHLQKVAEERKDEILHVLPFAIDLISSSMNAGLDFGAAVRYLLAGGEEDVLRREFAVFLRDVELGKTRTDALKDMQNRINLTEFSRFISAITYGMDSGSSIIDIMRIQAEEMRRVKFARAEQEAAKAPTKMIIPMALFVFPSMFIIIFVPILLKMQDSGILNMIKH